MSSNEDFADWDKNAEDMAYDKQKLLTEMQARLAKGETPEVLTRMAKANIILAKQAEKKGNKDLERQLADKAKNYAEKACKMAPNDPECHKWMCAALGTLANLSGAKEKIKYGHEFQQHAEQGLKLAPNDKLLQSMYGQWCYNVASLGWMERKVATAVYGAVPNADFQMALNAFKKVHEIDPQSKENHLWMAKTLIALKNTSEASQWIQKGLTLQNKNVSDEIAHQELTTLSKKYK